MSTRQQALASLAGRRVVLLTNQAARGPDGVDTLAAVRAAGPAQLTLLAPEHGLSAALPPCQTDAADERVLPFYFRPGGPEQPALPAADVYLFDLPLVGARYYTHLDGLRRLVGGAGAHGAALTVLDRPNPLGTACVEGPGVEEGYETEIASLDVPVRYGRTAGGLAADLADALGAPAPEVAPWQGPDPWEGEAFTPPSPNLRDLLALRLYPALCLLEGTGVSEGRGTATPFRWLGAPGLVPEALLEGLALPPGVRARPEARTPEGSKHAGVACPGVALEGTLAADVPVLGFGLRLLARLHATLPGGLDFLVGPTTGKPFLDLLWGGPSLRLALLEGADPSDLLAEPGAHPGAPAARPNPNPREAA